MFHRGWFLISVGDSMLSQQVARVISRYGVTSSEALDEAQVARLASSPRWAGCVADASTENLAKIHEIRGLSPTLPLLVVLTPGQIGVINRLQACCVEVAVAPVPHANLAAFAQRSLASAFLPHEGVAAGLTRLADERGLTAREVQLVSFSLGNEPRERVRRRLGICENTLKTQIRGLLRKCGERSVDALAKNLLRAVLAEKSVEDSAIAHSQPQAMAG